MLAVYGDPPGNNPEGFFEALESDLRWCKLEVLASAVRDIRQNRQYPTFPTIGECVAACRVAHDRIEPRRPTKPVFSETEASENYQRAYKLCRCDLGRKADEERWLPSLVQFVAERGSLPNYREASGLKAKGDRSDEGIELCDREAREVKKRSKGENMAPALDGWRVSMLNKHSRMVFGQHAMNHALILSPGISPKAEGDGPREDRAPIPVSYELRGLIRNAQIDTAISTQDRRAAA